METVHSNYIINCVNDYKDEVTYMNEKINLFFPGSYQFSFYEGSDFFCHANCMLPQHGGLHVGFFNLDVLRINRNRRKAVLTGLPRGDFFFGEVAAVRTQANIKPCR